MIILGFSAYHTDGGAQPALGGRRKRVGLVHLAEARRQLPQLLKIKLMDH